MGYEERSNKLPESQMRSEYVVHGHFLLSQNDQNAKPNAYWVSLHKMLKDVGGEAVKLEIDIFTDQAEADPDGARGAREGPERRRRERPRGRRERLSTISWV